MLSSADGRLQVESKYTIWTREQSCENHATTAHALLFLFASACILVLQSDMVVRVTDAYKKDMQLMHNRKLHIN